MGKFVGLVGALTTFGAVAYLMAPLPHSATSASDLPTPATTARSGAPAPEIVVASGPRASTADPAARPSASIAVPRGEPTVMLVQQIQAELNRLGCYDGTIDGQWSDATQRAMQTLGERVSVLRPVETPDYIMLALARSQSSAVCTPTRRQTAVPARSRLTDIATPAILGPAGQGAVRPNSGAPRVAASETARPKSAEPPKVWRAVPEAAPKRVAVRDADPKIEAARLKTARDELNRVETRKRAAVTTPADPSDLSSGPLPEAPRMGLGVGPGDPLQAHIDPRNPNAPAILRGPPQPPPRFALQSGELPAAPGANDPAAPARTALPPPPANAAPPSPARVASKQQAKRSWRRTIFTEMRFNGP